MKQIVVAIFDSATGTFSRPAFMQARGAAVRSFIDEVGRVDENNTMNKHPDDFTLMQLGTFDDEEGVFENAREVLFRAKDAISKE